MFCKSNQKICTSSSVVCRVVERGWEKIIHYALGQGTTVFSYYNHRVQTITITFHFLKIKLGILDPTFRILTTLLFLTGTFSGLVQNCG